MCEELKPCPRCGGRASIATVRYNDAYAKSEGWDQNEFYYVNCIEFGCGIESRGAVGFSLEAAAERWNTRPIEDALRTELAEAKEYCRESEQEVKEFIVKLDHRDMLIAALKAACLALAEKAHRAGVPCPGDGEFFDPEGDCREKIDKGLCPQCIMTFEMSAAIGRLAGVKE